MHHEPQDEAFSDSNLACPEYRERLLRKLNCLIAVLEVATGKVRQGMSGAGADVERLGRIHENLRSTLDVCQRARGALVRRGTTGPDSAPLMDALKSETLPRRRVSRMRSPLETSSEKERAKFEHLPPIEPRDVASVDFEDLIRRLQSL